jgi:hypothetical protein
MVIRFYQLFLLKNSDEIEIMVIGGALGKTRVIKK